MKRILLSIVLLLFAQVAYAQTFTRSMLFQQNQQSIIAYTGSTSSFLPQGAVAPSSLYSMFNNLIQGTGILSDNNTWSGTNTFNGPVKGISTSLIVGTSPITGTCTSGYNLYSNSGILGCQANAGGGSAVSLSVLNYGMASGGTDNSSAISTLMTAMGAPGSNDAIFPAVPSQDYTVFYFGIKSLTLSRYGNYHCAGSGAAGNSVELVFAPGLKGAVQENGLYSPDGYYAGGNIDGCEILTLGFGEASTTQNSSSITGVTMFSDPGGYSPKPTWHIGDGIMMSPSQAGFSTLYPATVAGQVVKPGAYVSNVVGTTLTLASGYTTHPQMYGYASAGFLETGTRNFIAGDTIQAGNNTFTAAASGTSTGTFQIGASFAVSAASLCSSINTNSSGATWGAPSTTPNISCLLYQTQTANTIVFTDLTSGTAGNTQPSIYTAAGTAAGAFPSATFAYGNALTTEAMIIEQLPATLVYTIVTASGSPTATITAGPWSMVPGDPLWSDAFPIGSTVRTVSGTIPTQTITVADATGAVEQNATQTHTSGSPGQAWVIPAALRRDTTGNSSNNLFARWPIGLEMVCFDGASLNCDGSYDWGNLYEDNFIGRWTGSNNTSASGSTNERFADNFWIDYLNAATLGEVDTNDNSNSNESGSAPYSIMGNCVNQNSSLFSGGYIGGASLNGCMAEVGIVPPTAGSPWVLIGLQDVAPLGSSYITTARMYGPWSMVTPAPATNCVGVNITTYTLAWSQANCGTTSNFGFAWNSTINSWDMSYDNSFPLMRMMANGTSPSFIGYPGQLQGVGFPYGLLLLNTEQYNTSSSTASNNWRMISAGSSVPTGTWHLPGDFEFNTAAAPGTNAGWIYTPSFTTTLAGAVTKGSTTSVSVGACPAVALPTATPITDTTKSPAVLLGTLSSCTSTTLTFQAAASNSGTNGDTITLNIWEYVGIVQDQIPIISSCGTSPTIGTGSTNIGGNFVLGTGTPTACTITFAHAYPNHGFCTVTPDSAGGAAISGGYYISAISDAGFTLTIGTGTSSLGFTYTCAGD